MSVTKENLAIPFKALKWAFTHVDRLGEEFDAYVVENTLPGGFVEHEIFFDEPEMTVGKTVYWHTSGAVTARRHLGHQCVSVIEIPDWFYQRESEEL